MSGISSIKNVVAVGIGTVLFMVLARFFVIASPVPNTIISIQYAVLIVFAIIYGPVTGLLIGFIAHTMMDLSWDGSPRWSWILASACVGFIIGLSAKKLNIQDGDFGFGKNSRRTWYTKRAFTKKDGAVIVKRRIVSGGNCTIKSAVFPS